MILKHVATFVLTAGLTIPAMVLAQTKGPCGQIEAACLAAGFLKGDAKEGFGLFKDCVDPIMKGTPQPPNAVKRLPAVPPDLVAACKAKHPNFGEGRTPPPPAT